MDFKELGNQASESDSIERKIVQGLHLQYDADFACYEVIDLEKSAEHNFKELLKVVDFKRRMAGAEHINCHITLGLKGGRNEIATVAVYQDDRNKKRDPALKHRVLELRTKLANYHDKTTTPVVWTLQEADDGMIQYQLARIATHGIDASAIMSGDKDLWMGEGKHCDPKTGRYYTVKGYGKTEYRDVGNVNPKLVGEGTSWFWHQMVMGDKADCIPGLPMLAGRLANIYVPTKKANPNRKAVKCGEAKAVAMLKDVYDDNTAAFRVMEAYEYWYGSEALEMFVEQAFLLWMRRTTKLNDVIVYLKSVGIQARFSENQKQLLRGYQAKAKALLQAGD